MEICIPRDRVPADILKRLKEIGHTLHSDSSSPNKAKTSSSSSQSSALDETDSCAATSRDTGVVHTPELDSTMAEKRTANPGRSEVVHILGASTPEKNVFPHHQYWNAHPHQQAFVSQQYLSPQVHKPGQPSYCRNQCGPDFRDRRTPSPNAHQFSPFKSLSCVEGQNVEEESRLQQNRSPRMQSRNDEQSFQHNPSFAHQIPRNPSSSSFTQPHMSRNTIPEEPTSFHKDDDGVRVFPTPPLSAPPDIGSRSPKVLTPPETPECEGKRKLKDIFTFDDLACTQERIRQNIERMHQLQETPFTPRRDVMKTPTPRRPPTPSYRRAEIPSSPRIPSTPQRVSPVDYPARSRSDAVSPQPKKQSCSEAPSSPGLSSSSQRAAEEDFYTQRRDSLSPQPRKKLNFDDDGIPPKSHSPPMQQQQSSQRMRGFDFSSSPFLGPSSRHVLDNPFPVSGFQGDCEGLYFTGRGFGVSETVDGLKRTALQSARFAATRKRQMFNDDDGSDDIALCTCAVMERNFLQMAECAYKRIRRMDSSPQDFERFRNELAQTNDILKESMDLMKHIREICNHRKRPRW